MRYLKEVSLLWFKTDYRKTPETRHTLERAQGAEFSLRFALKFSAMNAVQKIQSEISALPEADVRRLRDWLEEYESKLWDDEIEADAKSGRLDALAENAIRQHRAGKSKPI